MTNIIVKERIVSYGIDWMGLVGVVVVVVLVGLAVYCAFGKRDSG